MTLTEVVSIVGYCDKLCFASRKHLSPSPGRPLYLAEEGNGIVRSGAEVYVNCERNASNNAGDLNHF